MTWGPGASAQRSAACGAPSTLHCTRSAPGPAARSAKISVAGMVALGYDTAMHRICVDLERLKTLHCGLGQYSLHLGQWLARRAGEEFRLRFFVPPAQAALFANADVEFCLHFEFCILHYMCEGSALRLALRTL